LLPAGITHFFGDFESGDVVDLLAPTGEIVARGFVGHDAGELPGIIGRSLPELSPDLRHPVVHADDLVAVPQTNGVPGTSGPASPAPGRTRVGSTASSPIEGVQHVGR
jgi:glutamate 5-kinase